MIPGTKRHFDPSQPELMDQAVLVGGKPTQELERDLANLRWLNRHFGAVSLVQFFLNRWFSNRDPEAPALRILDLATGEGDLPREIVVWCRARNISLQIDAVDLNEATLSVAKERSQDFPEIRFHQGDIRSWGDSSQNNPSRDLILCSLALHHFSQEDAVQVLRNAQLLASGNESARLLVADLERSIFGTVGIWLLTSFFLREPMTVHDARLSISRAFSFGELGDLAVEAGWTNFRQKSFPVTRQAIWIEPPTAEARERASSNGSTPEKGAK